uniref:Uncharacterized protein n=1 Tax=Ciona savignyi TaxID=51511 RepID=H2YEG8_CIOSA
MHEQTQNELAELAATHQSKIKELHELTEKLQEMERKHEESKATIEIQQNELQRELTDLQQEESALRVKFNSLQEEADLRNTEKEVPNNVCHEDRGIQVEQMDKIDKLFNGADELENIVNSGKLKHSLKDQMDDLTKLQEELSSKNEVIEANEQEILSLKNDLDSARMAAVENVSEVTLLRHKLSEREDEMKTLLESATSDLQHQLSDAKLEIDARTNTADQLQDQLAEMESCLSELQNKHTMEVESRERCEAELKKFSEEKERQAISLTETNRELQAALYARAELLEQEESIRMQVEESEMMLKMCSSSGSELDSEDENSLSNGALVIYRGKLRNLRDKLKDSNKALEASQVENEELKDHLSKVQEKMATDEMVTVATQEFQPHVPQEVDLLVGGDCPVVDVKLLQDELDGA